MSACRFRKWQVFALVLIGLAWLGSLRARIAVADEARSIAALRSNGIGAVVVADAAYRDVTLRRVEAVAAVVDIGGHTASEGSDIDNQTLIRARADSVLTYHVAAGISRSSPVGVGNNSTDAGCANNRLIEFRVLENRP